MIEKTDHFRVFQLSIQNVRRFFLIRKNFLKGKGLASKERGLFPCYAASWIISLFVCLALFGKTYLLIT